MIRIAPIFVDCKRAPLKPVLEKEFCLPIDVLEQIGFGKNPRAFGENPSLGRFLGKERRIGPSPYGENSPCDHSHAETEDESFMTHHGNKE
jgi:hypothetical protein